MLLPIIVSQDPATSVCHYCGHKGKVKNKGVKHRERQAERALQREAMDMSYMSRCSSAYISIQKSMAGDLPCEEVSL